MLAVVFAVQIAQAQNYKAPKIDASGKITDKDGSYIGNVSKEGVVNDAMGTTIAHIDATGTLVDEKSGEKLGKAEKNGIFMPYFADTKEKGWVTGAPMNGTCLVKDKDGKIIAEVHENYKAFGACAIHCLTTSMVHGKVMEEKNTEVAAYVCPMHPEITSDKPGKCSKCGAELVKGTL